LVDEDGAAAALFLLQNSSSYRTQRDLLPVVVAAVKKNQIDRPHFAGFFDRLRVSAGMKQLFGTQVSIVNGLLVLVPIENEAQVDARRKEFNLPLLDEYLRSLERFYRTPLVRSPLAPAQSSAVRSDSLSQETLGNLVAPEADEDIDVVRIETNLVSLNVSVYNEKLRTHVGSLAQKDFIIFEDGHEEAITFFAATDVPFDLVLLIDLSSSTQDKRDLIRQTTRRFIEAARPADRLAIVAFSANSEVISPLTSDHTQLLASINKIDAVTSGSNVWDAVKFTLDQAVGPKSPDRRRAVVLMSDGVDNALGYYGKGSKISFADLLESVRHNDVMLIPIYLDTESGRQYGGSKSMYENARKTMALLADESGGLYYKASKVGDLNGVYEQVLNDLGKVYSLGYKPANEKRDGGWRVVKIRTPTHPELTTRARPGYYSN
jgi:VWFA-related protein